MTHGWWESDRGSASAELALLTPLLITVLVFVAIVIHRGVDARLRLDSVAHQAARAASTERTRLAATRVAQATVERSLADAGVVCVSNTVTATNTDLGPGGAVTITVSCVVDLGDALLLGVPTTRTVNAAATEPVDTWRSTSNTGASP